ncbi:peptide chain release factor 3 [Microbacterium suaedae]|uniref:peptide chain release factor 3 n=1 Tax=Microbacterium suaedae TaxID=2067813 RepID=UPI000DA1F1C3|nr:peptide chain release factor 3 [Microbacterium suaedae]
MTALPESHQIEREARRRRAIAVISHPDAGKSTLTEALLLHANAIGTAGAVHGKRGRTGTVSDWMSMERERGISITSTVIQFDVDGTLVNLVDTPGHADFSEDTYRVLSVVDAVVMLIDAAKGIESQTKKLFDVCFARGIPIITMVNKWDRPGRDPLDLIDEIRDRTGLICAPITWPVGLSGDFQGLLDPLSHDVTRHENAHGGGAKTQRKTLSATDASTSLGDDWRTAVEEVDLVAADGGRFDDDAFRAGHQTPLFFGAAVRNVGVDELLDFVVSRAPHPGAWQSLDAHRRPVDSPFSGYVFKVQTGMDPAHRDRIAFMRICSGVFERGMTVTHQRTGRPFATKYSQQVFGRERHTADIGWPGDVIGLVNATALQPGDTLFVDQPVEYPGLPRFAPEHFRIATPADTSRGKQFRKGVEQLDEEGVVQVLTSERRGPGRPILAAVGPMQFETFARRMVDDFRSPIHTETLAYSLACTLDEGEPGDLERTSGVEVARRADGTPLVLVRDKWRLRTLDRDAPGVSVTPLSGTVTTQTTQRGQPHATAST